MSTFDQRVLALNELSLSHPGFSAMAQRAACTLQNFIVAANRRLQVSTYYVRHAYTTDQHGREATVCLLVVERDINYH